MADWQIGDLALCVKVGLWVFRYDSGKKVPGVFGPRAGQKLTVRKVTCGPDGVALKFSDFPDYRQDDHWRGYSARRFIKVTPDAADAFDREVIAALTGAPQEVGA